MRTASTAHVIGGSPRSALCRSRSRLPLARGTNAMSTHGLQMRSGPNRCLLVTTPPTQLTRAASYGMWRAVALLAFLGATAQAAVFTEGGSALNGQSLQEDAFEFPSDSAAQQYDDDRNFFLNRFQAADDIRTQQDSNDEYMTAILDELKKSQKDYEEFPDVSQLLKGTDEKVKPAEQNTVAQKVEAAAPKQALTEKLAAGEEAVKKAEEELDIELQKERAQESKNEQPEPEPQVPQKKGQNEFVSFVEPIDAKQTKAVPSLDKRRLSTSAEYGSHVPRYNSSSLLLIAVGTVLAVGLVGTLVGGGYYLKRRTETPDDGEYAPYAGTGPGFKKNKGNQGDETLAYKAQLHQYQQAKQKIICGEDAPGVIESEGEDDGNDEENNFSVYECPGLAPTGDIEVCNPNFAVQP